MACLRQELIDAFVESRYMMFIKYAALQLQQLGLKKQMDIFNKETPAKEDAKVVRIDPFLFTVTIQILDTHTLDSSEYQTIYSPVFEWSA